MIHTFVIIRLKLNEQYFKIVFLSNKNNKIYLKYKSFNFNQITNVLTERQYAF